MTMNEKWISNQICGSTVNKCCDSDSLFLINASKPGNENKVIRLITFSE